MHSEITIYLKKMKNLFICVALLVSVLTVSCSKENEVKPQTTPATATTLSIEYRISNASGHVGVDYIAPNANGTLQVQHMDVNRTEQSISFNYSSGNAFSVTAYNLMPSTDVVQVQLFVNGVLKAEHSVSAPGQSAVAKGNF